MKVNKLTVSISRLVKDVFSFVITPPNSTRWIPGVIKEKTSELPIRIGTIYHLTNKQGKVSAVTVRDIKENEMVEWVSQDKNYHCRYILKSLGESKTEFEYSEWVDGGEIKEPFTIDVLEKLKRVLEL